MPARPPRLVCGGVRVAQRLVVEALFPMGFAQHVVALRLELAGQLQQDGDRRQEHAGRLPGRRDRTKRPIAWAK